MSEWIAGLFPLTFWKTMVLATMFVFSVVGLDLLLGSHLIIWMGRAMNKKISFDDLVVRGLALLKKNSDQEINTENMLLRGAGRLVAGGILLFWVYLMFSQLLPRLT